MSKGSILALLFCVAFAGEVMCVIKAVNCDWDPIGREELIYTGAAVTGFGAIVGWMDIEEGPISFDFKSDKTTEENE